MKSRFGAGLAVRAMAIGVLALTAQSAAAMTVDIFAVGNDKEWAANHRSNFNQTFGYMVREGTAGNRGWERAIVRANGAASTKGQIGWTDAADSHQFDFGFAGGAASLELTNAPTSGANPLTTAAVAPGADDNAIVVRAIARNNKKAGETDARADLGNLVLTVGGVSIDLGEFTSLIGDSNANYLVITGLDLASGFSLTGNAVFDIGNVQDGSRTAYQVSVGTYVPVPAALVLFATALAGLGFAACRRKPAV
jgi:hypothetical protein